jgi:hypothetical protein
MATKDQLIEELLQNPLVDVVMKCGQIVCGQVVDVEGDFVIVAEPDRSATCWVRQDEVAFIRLHPPLEPVRYPEDPEEQYHQQMYGSPYMPTVMDGPLPYPQRQPQQRPSGRRRSKVALAPDMQARLEQVKQRHRRAEFVDRRAEAPQYAEPEHAGGVPVGSRGLPLSQKNGSRQVFRPRIEMPEDDEEPQQ